MSLLWANQIMAVIGADSLAVVHRSRGFRRQILEQKHASYSQQNEMSSWAQATANLDKLLQSLQVKPKTQLNITLASDLVRYLALPPQQIHMNPEEKLAYALAAYREVYGAVAESWEIKLQDAPAHTATIAVAMDKELLAALNKITLKYALKLISVKPYLMSAFNSLHSQIGLANGVLAIIEHKRLLLINLLGGECQNVRTLVLSEDWQTELKNLMRRESLLTETDAKTMLIYAPAQKNTALSAIEGWQLKRISTLKNAFSNPQYSMLETAL